MKKFYSLELQGQTQDGVDPYTIKTWKKTRDPHDLGTQTPRPFNNAIGPLDCKPQTRKTQPKTILSTTNDESIFTRRANRNKRVRQQRTPAEIRIDDENREKSIVDREMAEMNINEVRSPRASVSLVSNVIMFDDSALGSVESKTVPGRVVPITASPQGSFTYLQSKIMLDLKKPRSGFFINEDEITKDATRLPFDPRKVQSEIDVKRKARFIIHDGKFATVYDVEPRQKDRSSKHTQVTYDRKCAISGTTHVGQSVADKESLVCSKNRALFVASIGIVYARLISAPTWTAGTVDNVLADGIDHFKLWARTRTDADPFLFPSVLKIGPFRIESLFEPLIFSGEFKAVSSYCCSELTKMLKETFAKNSAKAVVIEIGDAIVVSVWLKGGNYFLFDANERDEKGSVLNAEEEQRGAACLCMSNKLDPICELLYDNTKQLVETNDAIATISGHCMTIVRVDKLDTNMYIGPTIASKSTRILTPVATTTTSQIGNVIAISRVPHSELSDLSIARPKRKRKQPSPGLDSSISDGIKDVANDTSASQRTLEQICNDVLDPVIDGFDGDVQQCCEGHVTLAPVKRAQKVLVKSDLGFLQKLRRHVRRDINGAPVVPELSLTLSQERLIPSNFRFMPDGTEIIHGTGNVLQLVDFNKCIAFMTPLMAIVMAQQYCIATWDTSIVDRVLAMTRKLIAEQKSIGAPCRKSLNFQMPTKRCNVQVTAFSDCTNATIGTMLANESVNHLILTSTVCSAALVRRKHFWYLYDALPCNRVGMRSRRLESDVATLQRFSDVAALTQRMHSNGFFSVADQTLSLAKVVVTDVQSGQFVPRNEHSENEAIAKIEANQKHRFVENNKKIVFLNKKIKEETCRINKFNKKAGKSTIKVADDHIARTSKQSLAKKSSSSSVKRSRSKSLQSNASLGASETIDSDASSDEAGDPYGERLAQVVGYRSVSSDGLEKIQGTTCLPNRYNYRTARIRSCHLVSMYANMLAIHRPLDEWNFRHVDECIEEGLRMYGALNGVGTLSKRSIESVTLQGYQYNVVIENITTEPKDSVSKTLAAYFEKNRIVLLQFLNVTFAVRVDNNDFNLFDPYAALELHEQSFRIKKANTSNRIDKNTASWIRLSTMNRLIKYIGQRIRGGFDEMKVYIVNVRSFRKVANASTYGGHHLFMQLQAVQEERRKKAMADVRNEEVSWLGRNGNTKIPWSRRLDTNLCMQRRGTPGATWKSFEIELPDDLYSVWANIHPKATVFAEAYRGRQCLAVCVCAGAVAQVYPIEEWNERLMDFVVVQGDKLFAKRMAKNKEVDYEVLLEDFSGKFDLAPFAIVATVTLTMVGHLYSRKSSDFNLNKALTCFFSEKTRNFGVLQCCQKCLAFGRTSDCRFFVYDCQSMGPPLFWLHQGCAYLLLCTTMKRLLECIVVTLAVPRYDVEFAVHEVSFKVGDGKELKSTPSKSSLKKT